MAEAAQSQGSSFFICLSPLWFHFLKFLASSSPTAQKRRQYPFSQLNSLSLQLITVATSILYELSPLSSSFPGELTSFLGSLSLFGVSFSFWGSVPGTHHRVLPLFLFHLLHALPNPDLSGNQKDSSWSWSPSLHSLIFSLHYVSAFFLHYEFVANMCGCDQLQKP